MWHKIIVSIKKVLLETISRHIGGIQCDKCFSIWCKIFLRQMTGPVDKEAFMTNVYNRRHLLLTNASCHKPQRAAYKPGFYLTIAQVEYGKIFVFTRLVQIQLKAEPCLMTIYVNVVEDD